MKVFLSYGHEPPANAALVKRIGAALDAAGFTTWIDTAAIKSGDDWRRAIMHGLQDSDWTLAFLSRHAVRDPGVCLDELAIATHVKGGAIATVLIENPADVQPPVIVNHVQWIDMSDWLAREQAGGPGWDAWLAAKLDEIKVVLASPAAQQFAGDIDRLDRLLQPVEQAADIPPLLDGFVGREWLLAEVDARRRGPLPSRLIWIAGGPGTGKSAFSAWVATYQRANVIALNLCDARMDARNQPARALRTLAFQVARRIPDYRAHLLERLGRLKEPEATLAAKPPDELFQWLLAEPLFHCIDGGRGADRYLVVVDGLDETLRDGESDLEELLAGHVAKFPSWLAVVATSRPEPPIGRILAHIEPLRLEAAAGHGQDLRVYAHGRLGPGDPAQLHRVVAAAGGSFLYLRMLRQAVEAKWMRLDAPEGLPRGMAGMYRRWFRRQFPDKATYDRDWVPLLSVLAAARLAVPLDLLAAMFGWDVRTQARVLRQLGSLFEPVGAALAPCHASLRDWLVDPDAAGDTFVVDAARGSRVLANALWQRFCRLETGAMPDTFTLAELPVQLAGLDAGALRALLVGPDSLRAIAERMGGVVETLKTRVAWRSVLVWLELHDRLGEISGEAGLTLRHQALTRRAEALYTLGMTAEAMSATDRAVTMAEDSVAADKENAERRHDLGGVLMNRGNAKQSAPGHGPTAAIADYDRAIEIMQVLRATMGEGWPIPWRNDLAAAFMVRGNARQDAPGYGVAAAIADYDHSIEIRQALRESLGDAWPVSWRNDLAAAFMNRGNAKQSAPGHGPEAAIADFNRTIEIMQALRDSLGGNWPIAYQNGLAAVYLNRGIAKVFAPGWGLAAAIADFDRAIEIREALRAALGDDWPIPWRNDHAAAFMNRGNAKQHAPGHGRRQRSPTATAQLR